jgi:predicted RNA-binding protein with PUA-like domain
MAFTQSDVDALKVAIAARNGVRQMTIGDRSYVFDSVDDMIKLLGKMEQDVAAAASRPRTRFACFNKGV